MYLTLGFPRKILNSAESTQIRSFSDTEIVVIGEFCCPILLYPGHPGIKIMVTVIKNIPGSPDCLLGADLFKKGQICLSYPADGPPTVTFDSPVRYACTVFHASTDML